MVDWAVARRLGSRPFRASWATRGARRGSLGLQPHAQAVLPTERGYGRPSRTQMSERSLLAWRLQRSYGVLQLGAFPESLELRTRSQDQLFRHPFAIQKTPDCTSKINIVNWLTYSPRCRRFPICGRPPLRKGRRVVVARGRMLSSVRPLNAAGTQPPACMGVRGLGPDHP